MLVVTALLTEIIVFVLDKCSLWIYQGGRGHWIGSKSFLKRYFIKWFKNFGYFLNFAKFYLLTRVGPDTFLTGCWIPGWFLMPDIRYPAKYLAKAGYLENYRPDYQISGIKNQPYIRYPKSFNIQYPAGY